MISVLLLEDDAIIAQEIKLFLCAKGFQCDTVFDGELFFRQYKNGYDVYLLDINVPKINGLDVCQKLRAMEVHTPILMLTAYGELEDKVDAFTKGADDYLIKPFHLDELYMRINALCRRQQNTILPQGKITIANLSLNLDDQIVERDGKTIALTPKEYKLLSILALAKGKVVSKNKIAEQLWDYHIETNQNTIEVYINFLRNKIDKHHEPKLIHTKIGFGYYLKEE